MAAALAATPAAAGATKPKPALVYGGFATIQFDPAVTASLGIVVEPRTGNVKPTATGGVRYKIHDGKTTLRFPLTSTILSVGNLGLEQPATGRDLNFTDFTVSLKPTKSVLSARTGANIGYGGPRQTLLRIAPSRGSVKVSWTGLELKDVPITLTATGVTVMNQQFVAGPAVPFTLGQVVGTLSVKTRYYYPRARGGRS